MPHYYTLAEANAKLPQIMPLLEEMRSQGQQLAAVQARENQKKTRIKGNGHHNPAEDSIVTGVRRHLEAALREHAEQLAKWDIQVKDLARGLIDFPAQREGRTVYLCWQLGEPEVAYWHEVDSGFAGRQPVDDGIA